MATSVAEELRVQDEQLQEHESVLNWTYESVLILAQALGVDLEVAEKRYDHAA